MINYFIDDSGTLSNFRHASLRASLIHCRMHNGDRDAVSSGTVAAPQPAPVLLPPLPIVPSALGGLAVLGMVSGLVAAFVMFGDKLGRAPNGSASPGGKPAVIAFDSDRAPGAFKILPASFQNAPASVIAQLNMPEAEKRRVRDDIPAEGAVRLAGVILWNRRKEAGEVVEVSAATFSQTLTIMHKPVTFFLPVQPGGGVSIKAVRDGGGGGVTLGG